MTTSTIKESTSTDVQPKPSEAQERLAHFAKSPEAAEHLLDEARETVLGEGWERKKAGLEGAGCDVDTIERGCFELFALLPEIDAACGCQMQSEINPYEWYLHKECAAEEDRRYLIHIDGVEHSMYVDSRGDIREGLVEQLREQAEHFTMLADALEPEGTREETVTAWAMVHASENHRSRFAICETKERAEEVAALRASMREADKDDIVVEPVEVTFPAGNRFFCGLFDWSDKRWAPAHIFNLPQEHACCSDNSIRMPLRRECGTREEVLSEAARINAASIRDDQGDNALDWAVAVEIGEIDEDQCVSMDLSDSYGVLDTYAHLPIRQVTVTPEEIARYTAEANAELAEEDEASEEDETSDASDTPASIEASNAAEETEVA